MRYELFPELRPQTRADCLPGGKNAQRPCPFAACKHHLALQVGTQTGSVRPTFPGRGPEDLVETCTLDVADRGGATLEEIGVIMNLTRERVRQIEAKGSAEIEDELREAGLDEDDFEPNREVTEPAGAEEGSMGAYADPTKEEPDAPLRLMIHKAYNSRIRELDEELALREGRPMPQPSSDEIVVDVEIEIEDARELAAARALRGKSGALVPWTAKDERDVELWLAFHHLLQPGMVERARELFHAEGDRRREERLRLKDGGDGRDGSENA